MLLRISALLLGMWMLAVLACGADDAQRTAACVAHAKHFLASGNLIAARAEFQRALRLAPDARNAPMLRAQLQFINAELALTMRR